MYGIPSPFDSHFLVLTLVITFAIQLSVWAVSAIARCESAYDAAGAVNYVVVALLTFGLSGTWAPRQALSTGAVVLCRGWLGIFLLIRVVQRKGDVRFEEYRKHWWQLLIAFVIQAMWVWLCAMPCIVLNGEENQPAFSWVEIVGIAVFLCGFILQISADLHKFHFRGGCGGDPHRGRFLKSGCWSCSRHPNYCGELLIWWGIYIISIRPFVEAPWINIGWLALMLASPAFTTFLMVLGSGTLLSEQKFDTDYKLARPEEWRQYLANVPPMIPSFLYGGCLALPGSGSTAPASAAAAGEADGVIANDAESGTGASAPSSDTSTARRTLYSALPMPLKAIFCGEFPCYRAKATAKFKGAPADEVEDASASDGESITAAAESSAGYGSSPSASA